MNRIAKLRELRGWSQADLAREVRTSQPQINRLETGERKLTEEWMRRIAHALDVGPADLLDVATRAEFSDEVEPYLPEASADLARPLRARSLRYYRVKRPSVDLAGVPRGKVILVDQSANAIKAVKTGDIVLVEVTFDDGEPISVLRQFLAPTLLTTNRHGRNTSFSTDGEEFGVAIKGVMVPEQD